MDNSGAFRLRISISALLVSSLVGCISSASDRKYSVLDTTDYKIYSILLDTYVIPQIDSSINKDASNRNAGLPQNLKRNLMVVDSTKTYNDDVLKKLMSFTTDSILFGDFKKQNKLKCSIDTCFGLPIRFHKFSRSEFDRFLKLHANNGYLEIYKKHPDVVGIVELSKIGYTTDRNKALVEICFYQAPLNSFGLFVWLEHKNGNWIILNKRIDWIS